MTFQPADYGPILAPLLDPGRLPELGPGRPDPRSQGLLDAVDAGWSLCPCESRRPGKWSVPVWPASGSTTTIWTGPTPSARTIHSATGSCWHGIMHRREGDYPNAKYWFRRTGEHPVFPDLARSAARLAAGSGSDAERLTAGGRWDPYAFVDLCRACVSGRSDSAALCRRIQRLEWELLFDFCYRRATGIGIIS